MNGIRKIRYIKSGQKQWWTSLRIWVGYGVSGCVAQWDHCKVSFRRKTLAVQDTTPINRYVALYYYYNNLKRSYFCAIYGDLLLNVEGSGVLESNPYRYNITVDRHQWYIILSVLLYHNIIFKTFMDLQYTSRKKIL